MTLVVTAACGWLLAITLMVVATVTSTLEVCAWSMLIALAACVPTGALIITTIMARERRRTEALVEAITCKFVQAGASNVSQIRS